MWKLSIIVGTVMAGGYRLWMLRRRHVPVMAALGLSLDRRPLANAAAGAAIGALAMSAIFLVEWWGGLISVAGRGPLSALGQDLLTSFAVPLTEELVFRCALLGALLVIVRRPSAAIIMSAIVFGALHGANPNATPLSVISTTFGGLAYGLAFAVTERVWLPFGLHFGWNYFQARVFGFAISGGAVRGAAPFIQQHDIGSTLLTGGPYGPEGGLIGLGARLLVLALVGTWLVTEDRRLAAA